MFLSISTAMILSQLFGSSMLIEINLYFMGEIGETDQFAAVGLGNLVTYLLYYPLRRGIVSTLETFASHAAGRNDMRGCGLSLHRCVLILSIMYVPMTLALLNTENILVGSGMDPNVSRIAGGYIVA